MTEGERGRAQPSEAAIEAGYNAMMDAGTFRYDTVRAILHAAYAVGLAPLSKGDEREVMERCAKLVCETCRGGHPVEESVGSGLAHAETMSGVKFFFRCPAERIWEAISGLGQTPEREGKS